MSETNKGERKMSIKHKSAEEAKEYFCDQFDRATKRSARWIAVVARVTPDGSIEVGRTSWDFSLDRMGEFWNVLGRSLRAEQAGIKLPNDPLPAATLDVTPVPFMEEELDRALTGGFQFDTGDGGGVPTMTPLPVEPRDGMEPEEEDEEEENDEDMDDDEDMDEDDPYFDDSDDDDDDEDLDDEDDEDMDDEEESE
jgi:hypothetical protein